MEAAKKTLELEIRLAASSAAAQLKAFSSDIRSAAAHAKTFSGSGASTAAAIRRLNEESARAAKSFRTLGSSATEAAGIQKRVKAAAADLTDRGLAPQSAAAQRLAGQYRQLAAEARAAQSGQQGLSGSLSSLANEMRQLAPVAAALVFDKKAAEMAGYALSVSDTFRGIREDFGIMLGDMQAGAGLFDELQQFNFWTPFDIEQTAKAAKVLTSAKVPLKDLTQYLTRFGDLAQGNSQRFDSFINAFSKASAKGKADMEVLNVYLDQGVQILDALAEQSGVTSAEIVKMASKGEISFRQLDAAVAAMTAEGGQYYGNLAAASERLSSVQAGLTESVKSLAASVGDMLAPAVAAVLGGMTRLVDAINGSPIAKGILLGAVAALAAAINVKMIAALVSFIAKMWASYAATMAQATAMSTLNPVMIAAVAAVGVATAAYVAYAASQQQAAEATNAAALAMQKQRSELEQLHELISGLSDAQIRVNLSNVEEDLAAAQKELDRLERARAANPFPPGTRVRVDATGTATDSAQEDIDKAREKVERLTAAAEEYRKALADREVAAATKEANEALKKRNKLYEKTPEYQREQLEQELAFARSLYQLQTRNEDGTYSGFDRAKTDAIVRNLEQQLESLDKKGRSSAEWTTVWADKFLSAEEKIRREWDKAAAELAEKGREVFGEGFVNRPEYQSELEYLNRSFREQLDELREEGKVGVTFRAVTEAAQSATSGSDVGDFVQSIQSGTSAFGALISLVIKAVASLDSFRDAMNFVQTIIKKVFTALEPMLKDGVALVGELFDAIADVLKPFFAIIVAISNEVTRGLLVIIKPILALLEKIMSGLTDIWNEILVPISEVVAKLLNYIVRFINKVFHAGISEFEGFKKIVIVTTEMTEEMEKAQAALKARYEKLISDVDDLLSRQIDSIRRQYELGLITRAEYDRKAAAYTEAAEKAKNALEEEMNDKLEAIKNYTYATAEQLSSMTGTSTASLVSAIASTTAGRAADNFITGGVIQAASSGDTAGAVINGVNQVLSGGMSGIGNTISGLIEDISGNSTAGKVANAVLNPVGFVASGIKNLFKKGSWFDVGASDLPADQVAVVHKGETIIPRTFAEGIRAGDLALVGGGRRGERGGAVYVSVSVGGSVVTERELVDAVYDGISRGIRAGEKSPLPAA